MRLLKYIIALLATLCAVPAAARPTQIAPTYTSTYSATNGKFARRLSFSSFTQPSNLHFIMGPGDSRLALGGGTTGTYGTGTGIADSVGTGTGTAADGWLASFTGAIIREGNTPNSGIGGQTGAQALAYPRPAVTSGAHWTGFIDNGSAGVAGNIWHATVNGGGDPVTIGALLKCTGCTDSTIVNQLTGTAGSTGTYTISGSAQLVASTATFIPYYVYGQAQAKTIADTAANEAAIVVLWLGTNSAGSAADLAAMDEAIKCFTDPTHVCSGYGGPLPLYNGLPKTLLIFNETRRGVTTLGNSNQVSGSPAQFANYARTLERYSWDSGDSVYANPHVIVANTFDDPVLANLADTTNFTPNAGYFADGLHPAATAIWRMDQVAAPRLTAAIPATTNFAVPPDSTNTASWLNTNPIFTAQSGGTNSSCSGVISSGAIPANWSMLCTNVPASSVTIAYNTIDVTHGSEMVVTFSGTPSGNMTITFQGLGSSAQRTGFNLATDSARATCLMSLTAGSGSVVTNQAIGRVWAADQQHSVNSATAGQVVAAGWQNNALYPMLFNNPFVNILDGSYVTNLTKNIFLGTYGATGNPGTLRTDVSITVLGSLATSFTWKIKQCSLMKVVN